VISTQLPTMTPVAPVLFQLMPKSCD